MVVDRTSIFPAYAEGLGWLPSNHAQIRLRKGLHLAVLWRLDGVRAFGIPARHSTSKSQAVGIDTIQDGNREKTSTRTDSMEKPNIHPEVAEPMIDQLIQYYVWAGLRVGLEPDWEKYRVSQLYAKGIQHFGKEAFDKRLAKAEAIKEFAKPTDYGAPGSVTERVIRDYVNAGIGMGVSPDWTEFRASQFYEQCTKQFTKDEVEKATADAQKQTDKLNVPLKDLGLPPEFFGKK